MTQNGYSVHVNGPSVCWNEFSDSESSLQYFDNNGKNIASCWHSGTCIRVISPDNKKYKLSLYFFDYDKLGRDEYVVIKTIKGKSSTYSVDKDKIKVGIYLIFEIQGSIELSFFSKTNNPVISGIFID